MHIFIWNMSMCVFLHMYFFIKSSQDTFHTEQRHVLRNWINIPRISLHYLGWFTQTFAILINGTTKLVINSVIEPRVFQSGSLHAHIRGRCLQRLTNRKRETLQSILLYHSSKIWRNQTHHPGQKQHCCCSKSQEGMRAEKCRH